MTKITSIPPEVEARFPEIVNTWVAKGLSTGPVDKPKMEDAVRRAYRSVGLAEPELFIWMDSPLYGVLAAWMLKNLPEVSGQVRDQVRGQVWDQVSDQVLNNVVYGQYEVAWLSYFTTLLEIGAHLDDKHSEWLGAFAELSEMGWWIPYNGLVVMTGRPQGIIHQDAQGRLHHEKGPAMKWADGWRLYAVHGVRVPEDIIEHPEDITAERVLKESNAEVRRVMCEQMGWDRFVDEAKLELVDECPDPANSPHTLALYDTPEQVLGVPIRVLLCSNATPERDGVVRRFGLTVPVECETALGASAWTFDLTEKQYRDMARAT